MFTGIVEAVTSVADVAPLGGAEAGKRLTLKAPFAAELTPGDSVAVDGACLTAVAIDAQAGTFAVETVEETLRKTNLGTLEASARVNVERALPASGRLDGHFVQGHVDATARVLSVEPEETGRLYYLRFDPAFAHLLIPTGSVALDGISLTVARLDREAGTLAVAIIPHTYEATAIQHRWTKGTEVNLEFDLIGKYVAGGVETRRGDSDFAP